MFHLFSLSTNSNSLSAVIKLSLLLNHQTLCLIYIISELTPVQQMSNLIVCQEFSKPRAQRCQSILARSRTLSSVLIQLVLVVQQLMELKLNKLKTHGKFKWIKRPKVLIPNKHSTCTCFLTIKTTSSLLISRSLTAR